MATFAHEWNASMSSTPALRVRTLSPLDWPLYRDLRLQALADAPDAFSATHAQASTRTDDDWAARLAAAAQSGRDCPLVAECDGVAVGLGWVKRDDGANGGDADGAELYQVWVAPTARGRGAGSALLNAATAWSREMGARSLRLGVTWQDSAALRMYRRAGFEPVGPAEPLRPGATILSQPMRLTLAAA
jgi:ribosomal protein S18 acetylase RimI-like enzyme